MPGRGSGLADARSSAQRRQFRAALAVSLLVHAAAVGGVLRHAAERSTPRAPSAVRVASAEPARAASRTADALDAADVAEQAEAARPTLTPPEAPRSPPRPLDRDHVPELLPRPVAPLSAPDLLPPAASVLVSIRAVRPVPPPPVTLPDVVLTDVLAAGPPPATRPVPDTPAAPEAPTPSTAPAPTTPPSETDSAAVIAPEPSASNRPPRYPSLSRRLGEQGEVVVRAVVGEDGRVLEAEVVTSSGHARLDEAALTAVRAWLFTPATRHGRPVVHPLEVPVLFELQE